MVERFGGRERANAAARLLLIDRDRHSRLPYVLATGTGRDHRDSLVHQLLDLIDNQLDRDMRVDRLAAAVGLRTRSLGRRCQVALGTATQAYIRARRIEHAKRELETTTASIDAIRRAVGYRVRRSGERSRTPRDCRPPTTDSDTSGSSPEQQRHDTPGRGRHNGPCGVRCRYPG